jgi:hypothetical protein
MSLRFDLFLNPPMRQGSGWKAHLLRRREFWLGVALGLLGTGSLNAQITTISQGSQLPSPQVVGSMPDPNNGPRESNPELQQQQIQELKKMRREELLSDTSKLLKLTTQLNSEMDQDQGKPLSREQLRIASKIEKLARNIRKNMSTPLPGLALYAPSAGSP